MEDTPLTAPSRDCVLAVTLKMMAGVEAGLAECATTALELVRQADDLLEHPGLSPSVRSRVKDVRVSVVMARSFLRQAADDARAAHERCRHEADSHTEGAL